MTIRLRAALLRDDKSCEECFRREWAGGVSPGSAGLFQRALAGWHEDMASRGCNFPPSFVLDVSEAISRESAASRRSGQWGADSPAGQRCAAFLEKVRASEIARRFRAAVSGGVPGADVHQSGRLDAPLFEAVLLTLRREEDLLSLPIPLYPPDWLRTRLEGADADEFAAGRVAVDDPFCAGLLRLLKGVLPEMAGCDSPFLYPFAVGGDAASPAETSVNWLEGDRGCCAALSTLLSPWGGDGGAGFNETVAAKYDADYALEGNPGLARREKEIELLVKTPDPSRFPRSFETITCGGIMLPTEAAQEWPVFVKKFLENELLGATSLERVRAPIHIHAFFTVFLDWEDETRESWEGIPLADHLHALMLLAVHDVALRLGRMRHVRLKITLRMSRGGGTGSDAVFTFFAKDLFRAAAVGEPMTATPGKGGLLMRSPLGLSLFRSLPLFSRRHKSESSLADQDPRHGGGGQEIHVYLRGTSGQTRDERLGSGVVRITVGADGTDLEIYSVDRWMAQESPSHLAGIHPWPGLAREQYWRKIVLHMLLGRVAQHVAASQAL